MSNNPYRSPVTQVMESIQAEARDATERPQAGRLERAFVLVSLVLYSGGFLRFLSDEDDTDTPELRFLWLPLYLLTIAFAASHYRQVRQVAAANWPLLLLVGLCCLSALWSVEPDVSLRRGIAVGVTTLFGMYLAARFEAAARFRLLAWCFAIMAAASVLVALALPELGVHTGGHAGAWRGVFPQKNAFGQMMVYGAAVSLVLALVDQANRRKCVALFLLCVALVALSTSITSAIALTTLLTITAALTLLVRHRAAAVVIIYVSILGGSAFTIALLADPEAVFGAIGRDPTLTGRTDIWEPLLEVIGEHFWVGHGYAAFWYDPIEGPARYIRKLLQWDVPSAHNGWAELWLDLGALGVGAFLITFVGALYRTFARVRVGAIDTGLWPFLFLTLFVVFSFSESSILRHNDLTWVIYVATIAAYGFRPVAERSATTPHYPGMAQAGPPHQGWSAWRS